jgi:cell division protein FtsA
MNSAIRFFYKALFPSWNLYMLGRSQVIAGVDVGTDYVRVVIARRYLRSTTQLQHSLEILGYGSTKSQGIRRGIVVHAPSIAKSIKKAISDAEQHTKSELSSVSVSISGQHVKCIQSHGIGPIRYNQVTPADVEQVMESAQAVVIPHDREILHALPKEFLVDEEGSILNPVGRVGVRLEARINIITCAANNAKSLMSGINQAGFSVSDIVCSALASSCILLTEREKEEGVIFIDIGSGTTDIALFQRGTLLSAQVLGIGSNNITNDLASCIGTSLFEAEQIKKNKGGAIVPEQTTAMVPVPLLASGEISAIPLVNINYVINKRVQDIFYEVEKIISNSFLVRTPNLKVVITGGGSFLHGMKEVAQGIVRLPVCTRYLEKSGAIPKENLFTNQDKLDSKVANGNFVNNNLNSGYKSSSVITEQNLLMGHDNTKLPTNDNTSERSLFAVALGLLHYDSQRLKSKTVQNHTQPLMKRVSNTVGNWFSEHF